MESSSSSSRTWPASSGGPRFSSLPIIDDTTKGEKKKKTKSTTTISSANNSTHISKLKEAAPPLPPPPPSSSSPAQPMARFTELPSDVLARIAAAFDVPELWAASLVCRSWGEALRPLRVGMALLFRGKRFKHGGPASRPDPRRALECFFEGTALGSAPAMVDAGLMCWEIGRKEEGKALYRKAAELGYPAGQCNLGICYLEAEKPEQEEAVKWFYRAAESGCSRAQYNLALCFHRGRGIKCSLKNAAKWYLRAAEGGNVRAMYNISLCYSLGEGIRRNHQQARMWMKWAADSGHRKAQFEHGLQLFTSGGDMVKALLYIELATRAGETAAANIRTQILQSLSRTSQERAMLSADNWKPTRFRRQS